MTTTVQAPHTVRTAVLLTGVSTVLDIVQGEADALWDVSRNYRYHEPAADDDRAVLHGVWVTVERAARATRKAVEWKRHGASPVKNLEDAHTEASLAAQALRMLITSGRFRDAVDPAVAIASVDAAVTCLVGLIARARNW